MDLELKNISIHFSHKVVLQNINLKFSAGQLHALLGENGAGKSTTANIITGELQPDSGNIFLNNEPMIFSCPKDAIEKGICYVHQRPMLADSLSIKENLFLGINKNLIKKNNPDFEKIVRTWLPKEKLSTLVQNIGSDTRFFTALCSALLKNPDLLILDEPSALLDNIQRDKLYEQLHLMAENGMNIIVITHSLYEAQNYCHTISRLENGIVKSVQINQNVLSTKPFVQAENNQLEKTDSSIKGEHSSESKNNCDETLCFKNITYRPKNQPGIFNLNFSIKNGEILLIQGLPEDGLLTLENAITGFTEGTVAGLLEIQNRFCINLKKHFTTRLLRKTLNTGIIPTDRKYRASNPELTIEEVATFGEYGNTKLAEKIISIADIQITPTEKAKNLSGGMLQRLILARELINQPEFLILCQPLQGLDVQACHSICNKIQNAAENGAKVLILSSGDFPVEKANHFFKLNAGKLQEIF
ncbi:MAG: ATP-binding cassette domain-containing protein [Treponema sp.]|nr:ATP-binding cassette domain-containing protein [Treponema sp.]